MSVPDFDDLDEDIQQEYLAEAYEELYADNQIPYGVATGDNDTWDQYGPVIDLARRNYESEFD